MYPQNAIKKYITENREIPKSDNIIENKLKNAILIVTK